MFRRLGCTVTLTASTAMLGVFVAGAPTSAAAMPSGQVMYGGATFDAASGSFVGGGGTIEPAYNDATGTLLYLQTPNGPPIHPANHIDPATGLPKNVAPIYLPVYPAGSGIDPASLNCAHVPADNCPDHGPLIAGILEANFPAVYGNGVLGHDHLIGVASSGGDFNILWEPVLVVFTSVSAASTHITTLDQIRNVEASGGAFEIPLAAATFHCSMVSAAAYQRGTPSPTVVGP